MKRLIVICLAVCFVFGATTLMAQQSATELDLIVGCDTNGIDLTNLSVTPVVTLVGNVISYEFDVQVTADPTGTLDICNARINNITMLLPDNNTINIEPDGNGVDTLPYWMAPGYSVHYGPVDYTITGSEVNTDGLNIIATAFLDADTQQDVGGNPVYVNADNDKDIVALVLEPAISVTKLCDDPTTGPAPGQPLGVHGEVCNEGNVDLDNVQVSNDASGNTINIGSLAVDACADWTDSYVPEFDPSCQVTDTVTATAVDSILGTPVEDSATAVCPIICEPCLEIAKVCQDEPYSYGDDVCFDVTVTNCGEIELTNVSIDDATDGTIAVGTLAVGASATVAVCEETVLECGPPGDPYVVSNTASATAESVGGPTSAGPVTDTCDVICDPCLEVAKTCQQAEPYELGDDVCFDVTVTNCGDVDLSNVQSVDSLTGPMDHGSLAAGASVSYEACVVADECGEAIVENSVTATGDSPAGSVEAGPEGDTCDVECRIVEICRTPGFWGQHACAGTDNYGRNIDGYTCEKKRNAENITLQVLDVAEGAATLCGHPLTDTLLESNESALEAINVRMKEGIHLQYLRQGAAAILNCLMSGAGAECNGMSINADFDVCEDFCIDPSVMCGTDEQCIHNMFSDCVDRLDAFNNGHIWDDGEWMGYCDGDPSLGLCNSSEDCDGLPCANPENCHERDLCNEDLGLCWLGGKPAGSSKAGNDAIQNCTWFADAASCE